MSAHIRRVEDRASAMAVVISARWVGACASTQRWQRTAASASRKVGSALAYRPGLPRCLSRWQWVGGTREASRVVRLTSPSRHGVLRATARALQWRCVSQAPICLDFLAGDRRLRPSDLPTHDLEHRVLLVRAEEAESGPKWAKVSQSEPKWAKEGEGLPCPGRVAHQHPAQRQRQRRLPIAMPACGPRRQAQGSLWRGCYRLPAPAHGSAEERRTRAIRSSAYLGAVQ